ncbi:GW dipeptide domain-containing protein [Jeotgalicoccus sp. ATCC 8456]|uniref:GW dipeptide domain-containing protein n=1 Tax=Jeotgalicoccus sp. ATCC 8456 TaxID=946435 RepID=UPI0018E5FB73|nr:GW dipeptide domain-containing protein [Jeotgalicoccus sp. ATCC 8456]QQD85678.1 SH3-like domain-containing protein [Jeotgalicoccus sp. ATCC 8456]
MEHKLDKFFRHVKEFDVSHYVWIYEKGDKSLLQSVQSMKKIGDLKDYQKQIVRVLAHRKVNKKNFYYLEHNENELGWAELRTSIVVYSKPREHVRLDLDKFMEQQDKQIFVVAKNNLRLLKDQMLDSRFVMIKDGIEYEALFKKHRLQGWFSSDTLIRSEKAKINVISYSDELKLYEFNNLTSEVKIDEKKIYPITIVHMFRDINLAKVKTGMGNFWTDMTTLEYDKNTLPEYERPYTFDEIVVYDLIQNISEERTMTKALVERLNSQFKNTDIEIEPSNKEEIVEQEMDNNQNVELLKAELAEEKEKRQNIEKRYKNLKQSFFGKLQTKYWQMRK